MGERKLIGLEKVYLQRLEGHNHGRNKASVAKLMKNKTRTKFRGRDRLPDEFEAFEEERGDEISSLFVDNYKQMTQKFKASKTTTGFM